ncbi:MAG: ABC transporter permease [Acidobacteria bacterium]|nr:ABC transporter permease [Acidobacteriota bacterium]
MAIWAAAERFGQDLRYAGRGMWKTAAFTIVAVISLALGISGNTAIFTFVNAALLKPLPYRQGERIVAVMQSSPQGELSTLVHPRTFLHWHENSHSVAALSIAQQISVNTQGVDGPEEVPAVWAPADLFRVFGVNAALGRVFTEEEARSGSAFVAVLDHSYWRSRFGGDAAILGKSIRTGDSMATVIGVLPAGFQMPGSHVSLYLPLPLDPAKPEAVGSRAFECYGLLRPGITLAQAQAELAVIANQFSRQNPVDEGWSTRVVTLRDYLVRDSRRILFLLLAIVAIVLLIACANVAGLLVARGHSRRAELALRCALGASRSRLMQQLLVESLALSMMGGALGLALGILASRSLVFLAKDVVAFGQMNAVSIDGRVLSFTLILSVLTALFFGFIPAWKASRLDLQTSIKGQGHAGVASTVHNQFRSALVIGEVALSVVLLVGAGLLLRTFTHLLDVRLGFQPEHVLTMRTMILGEPDHRAHVMESMLQRVETIPGVRSAGLIQFLPLAGWRNRGPFHFIDKPLPVKAEDMQSDVSTVSRGYFDSMGIPLLKGRAFDQTDRMDTPRVALVNESFVKRFLQGENPIGQQIVGDWADPKNTEIIGVVGDIRHNGLTSAPQPTVFLAESQVPGYITYLLARTIVDDPMQVASAIRHELQGVAPTQPFADVQPMGQYVRAALERPRLYTALLSTFASLALVLAAVGLYGLIAYIVRVRTHEIGIRMALGADQSAVLRLILGQTARRVGIGMLLGLVLAVPATRSIGSLLYGIRASDPLTFVAVATVLALAAFVAVYVPVRRASKIDPMLALRYE